MLKKNANIVILVCQSILMFYEKQNSFKQILKNQWPNYKLNRGKKCKI